MLTRREYNVSNALKNQDDDDMVDSVVTNYENTITINDAIHEVADNSVSIYTRRVFENAYALYAEGAWEEAVVNGVNNTNLEDALRSAWYFYNRNEIEDNLETILYNYAYDYLYKEHPHALQGLEDEDIEEIILQVDCDDTFEDFKVMIDGVVTMKGLAMGLKEKVKDPRSAITVEKGVYYADVVEGAEEI